MLALSVAAFGIYILYVSAAQVRRLHGGHGYLRPDDAIIKPGFGLGAAAALYGVWILFVIPWMARESGLVALYMALTAIAAPLLVIALAAAARRSTGGVLLSAQETSQGSRPGIDLVFAAGSVYLSDNTYHRAQMPGGSSKPL